MILDQAISIRDGYITFIVLMRGKCLFVQYTKEDFTYSKMRRKYHYALKCLFFATHLIMLFMANQFMFLISLTSYLMPFWGFFYAFKKYKTINTYYSTTFENVHLLYLFFRVTICKITSNGGQGFSHGNQPPRAVYSGIFKFTIIITLYYFIKDSFKMYLTATSFLSLCHFKLWKFPRVSCLLYTMHIETLFAFSRQPILQNQINQEKEIEIEIHKVSINSFKYCKIVLRKSRGSFWHVYLFRAHLELLIYWQNWIVQASMFKI